MSPSQIKAHHVTTTHIDMGDNFTIDGQQYRAILNTYCPNGVFSAFPIGPTGARSGPVKQFVSNSIVKELNSTISSS